MTSETSTKKKSNNFLFGINGLVWHFVGLAMVIYSASHLWGINAVAMILGFWLILTTIFAALSSQLTTISSVAARLALDVDLIKRLTRK